MTQHPYAENRSLELKIMARASLNIIGMETLGCTFGTVLSAIFVVKYVVNPIDRIRRKGLRIWIKDK